MPTKTSQQRTPWKRKILNLAFLGLNTGVSACLLLACMALLGACGSTKEAETHRRDRARIPHNPGLKHGANESQPADKGQPAADKEGEELQELASLAFRSGKWTTAHKLFTQYKASESYTHSSETEKRQIEIVHALSALRSGSPQDAGPVLRRAADSESVLSDFFNAQAALAFLRSSNYQDCELELAKIPSTSSHYFHAQLIKAALHQEQGQHKQALVIYEQHLQNPQAPDRGAVLSRLATSARETGNARLALQSELEILTKFPLSRFSRQILTADKNFPKVHFAAIHWIDRGHSYYKHNRNEKSEADFRQALQTKSLSKQLTCDAAYHLANSVYKQRDRTKAFPLFQESLALCKNVNDDLYVKSAYQGGRSLATLGKKKEAIAWYLLIEKHHPKHSYADDARLLQAEEWAELGQDIKAKRLLADMATKYPDGDMKTESLWRLAWSAYKGKRFVEALSWLQKQEFAKPVETRFDAEGQAIYWQARTLGSMKKEAKEIETYKRVIRSYPLSYYALLALNRLREKAPKEFEEVRLALGSPAPKSGKGLEEGAGDTSLDLGSAGLKARAFMELNLVSEANEELARAGLSAPGAREAYASAEAIAKGWKVANVYSLLGLSSKAVYTARYHLVDYKRHWPEGAWRAKWKLAFPRAYALLIENEAESQGFDSELLFAFIREESGFDPKQESFANAMGLAQIILPTAERFATGVVDKVDRTALQKPAVNIAIAARYIAFLLKKWDGRVAHAVPSYNAGEGAVARWLKERGDWEQDAWSEEIPYDETRRYSKRVIASYFRYLYLKDGTIPVLPN